MSLFQSILKVQIRPWRVSNSYFMANSSFEGDSRNAVFVGGVPRPLKASELADVMLEKFGAVTFIAIDCDSDLKYPKGKVVNQSSSPLLLLLEVLIQ